MTLVSLMEEIYTLLKQNKTCFDTIDTTKLIQSRSRQTSIK